MLRIQLIIYAIITLILGGGFFVIKKQSQRIEILSTNIRGMEVLYGNQIEIYQNRLDRQTARYEAAVLTFNQLRSLREHDRLNFIEQFEGVKSNLKNLHSAYTHLTEAVGSIETNLYDTTIVNIDSTLTRARKFSHKTEFMEAKGLVYDSLLTMDYKVRVPLEGVVYWERLHWMLFGKRRRWLPRFLGDKKYTVEVTSPNPNVTITGGQYIKVQKK